jgi:hypothetical protein
MMIRAQHDSEGAPNVEIAFREGWLSGRGSFTQVRRDGTDLGIILQTAGVYRFYIGSEPKLARADLENVDLGKLKTTIQEKYGKEP